MTSRSQKPVKECEGCALNASTHCRVFEHPALKWLHRDCEGYNNEELIARYGIHNDGQGAHARKAARQLDAKKNEQVEHLEDNDNYKRGRLR
jgi:hypothetical protein